MNVSRIGFSGNYCFVTRNYDEAKVLTQVFKEMKDKNELSLIEPSDVNEVIIATDNPQYSSKDFKLIEQSIRNAGQLVVKDNSENTHYEKALNKGCMFNEHYIKMLNRAFRIVSRGNGIIDSV